MYKIIDREAGNIIEQAETIKQAQEIIAEYEAADKRDGTYTPDFYEILNKHHQAAKGATKMKHTANLNNEQFNIKVEIKLNDECKNGHQDFSITGTLWEAGKPRTEGNIITCGCIHDEILKAFPEFLPFVKLHLCDYDGVPMHALANMRFHMFNGFNSTRVKDDNFVHEYCDYYRITKTEFEELFNAKSDKLHFNYVFESLPIRARWKEEAQDAIRQLEGLTGETFVNTSTRSNFTPMSDDNRALIIERIASNYYSTEAIAEREAQAKKEEQEKYFTELDSDLHAEIKSKKKEVRIKKQLYLLGGKRFVDNVIYYAHNNTLKCNWRNYASNELDAEEVARVHAEIQLEH